MRGDICVLRVIAEATTAVLALVFFRAHSVTVEIRFHRDAQVREDVSMPAGVLRLTNVVCQPRYRANAAQYAVHYFYRAQNGTGMCVKPVKYNVHNQ